MQKTLNLLFINRHRNNRIIPKRAFFNFHLLLSPNSLVSDLGWGYFQSEKVLMNIKLSRCSGENKDIPLETFIAVENKLFSYFLEVFWILWKTRRVHSTCTLRVQSDTLRHFIKHRGILWYIEAHLYT